MEIHNLSKDYVRSLFSLYNIQDQKANCVIETFANIKLAIIDNHNDYKVAISKFLHEKPTSFYVIIRRTKTTQKLKTSTDKKEIEKLTRELINSTTKLALNCAKVNDKVGLLDALEILKDYAKSDENRKELEGAINHIEYLIKESIPLGSDTINKLNVLINRIKRDWR